MIVPHQQAMLVSKTCRFTAVLEIYILVTDGCERCSAAPSVWVSGETIDETIAFGARNLSFTMALVRTSDRDACGLHIFKFQNPGAHRARVPSPSAPTWMVLASDMRARSSNDRFRPHAYGHGASVRGECAIGACRSRRWRRTVARDGRGPGSHMTTTSV